MYWGTSTETPGSMPLGHIKAEYATYRQSPPVKEAISAAANAGKPRSTLIESQWPLSSLRGLVQLR